MADKPFPKNPYVIGVPLTGDVGFYGRRNIFTFVKDALDAQQQNVIVLYGQRRVGKTSLLHQISKQLKDEGQLLPIYFDLQGKEQQSLGLALYSLARTIARPLNIKQLKQDRFDDAGRFFREEFLPSVYKQLDGRRLLLLFDEFDVLGDELSSPEAASEILFPYLQDLIMHQRQMAFIFVVGRRIEELATHFQAIFKQAIYRQIGLLRPEDARTLVVEPVKEILNFEDGAVEAILDLTAGHPYFTQLICFETFNAMKAQNQRVVTQADVLTQIDQAIETGHGALNWFWEGLPRAERFIMSAVAHVTDETGLATQENIRQILEKHRIVLTGLELKDAPDRLVEWEMLRREGPDNYRFVVELVRRWIIKTHPLESARRDVDYISQRAVRLYEIARDAHTEGDLEDAREYYQRALDANPNHSGAQLGLAQVLFEFGEIEAAIEEYLKAYAIDEMSARDGLVRARLVLGKKLEEANQQNEAILQYEQTLDIAPTNETTRRRLANIWQERGDTALADEGLAAALEPYQKAIDFDRSEAISEKIKFSIGDYVQEAETDRNYDEAIRAINQLRTLLPESEAALELEIAFWIRRGDTLAQEDKAEAIRAYQRALELRPDDDTLTQKLEAISAEWEKLLEADHLFNQALFAHQDKNWPTAEATWLQLLKMDVLDYKGRNIATFLAEAHAALTKHSSLSLQLTANPQQVEIGQEVTWTATVHNDGDDDLSEVVIQSASKKALNQPFNLAAGDKRNLTFTSSYRTKGAKTVEVKVMARASNGDTISDEATASVQVHQPKPSPPPKPKLEMLTITKPFKMELVRVPAGEFLMGSDPAKDKDAGKNEQPQHKVNLPKFYISKYPVTNAQYAAFLKKTGHKAKEEWIKEGLFSFSIRFPSGDENYPATFVTWYDAVAFCRWLTQKSGYTIRLPTEAEWEKAARGADGQIYPWGNDWDQTRLNSSEGRPGQIMPVGHYSPQGDSPYGAADMAGNVWEWCSTLWVEKAYPFQVQDEWQKDYLDRSGVRVVRGGSWLDDLNYTRCACRDGQLPDYWFDYGGFRVVVSPI